jgi:hypothetical protein
MSNSRKYFRKSGITNNDLIKQEKVVARYKAKYEEFSSMSLNQLDAIKNDKRSKTDEFAFKTAYIMVEKKVNEENVNPVAD